MKFGLLQKGLLSYLLLMVFLGCTGAEQDTGGKKVIRFWQFIASPEYLNPVIQKFEADNPEVRVQMQQLTYDNGFEKIVTSIAAGTEPDICEIGSTWLARFADEGAVRSVDTLALALSDSLLMLDMVRYKNHFYGLPWMLGTRVLFYNTELMALAGLDSTRPPRTWEELKQFARKIHKPDKGIYGFGLTAGEAYSPWQKFIPLLWQFNGDVADRSWQKCTLGEQEAVSALQFYASLKKVSIVDRQGQLDQLFNQGNLGFNISGSWNLSLIPRNNPGLKYNVSLMPSLTGDEKERISIAGGEVLVFMRNSRLFKETQQFAKYLLRMENMLPIVEQQKNIIPSAKKGIEHPYYDKNPKEKLFYRQLLQSRPLPVHPRWIEIQDYFTRAIERVLINNENPASVLKEEAQKINKILNGKL